MTPKGKEPEKEFYTINIVFGQIALLLERIHTSFLPIHFLFLYFYLQTMEQEEGNIYFLPFLLNQTIGKKTFFCSFSIFSFFSSLTKLLLKERKVFHYLLNYRCLSDSVFILFSLNQSQYSFIIIL